MNDQFRYNPESETVADSATQKSKKKDGYATAALVLGIVALVLSCPCCCCLYPAAGICAVLAIVFSSISLKRNGKSGKAIAALILGIVALLIVLIVLISMLASPDLPDDADFETEQAYFDYLYQWIERVFGTEVADEWYNEIMGSMQDPVPIE